MDFSSQGLHSWLDTADDPALECLDYGVVGLDREGRARRYTEIEARLAGLNRADVLGRLFFSEIARCMNNGIVATRFEEARSRASVLDATIDYVLAFKTGLTPVRLRLLGRPDSPLDYLLVQPLPRTSK